MATTPSPTLHVSSNCEQANAAAQEELRAPLIGYFRRRVRQQDEVSDLVQNVFLRLSGRDRLDDIDNWRGYVVQVASSVLTGARRRRAVRHRDAHVGFDPERMAENAIEPDRILASREI